CGGLTGSSSRPSAAAGAPARLRRSAASGETCAARWPRLPSSTTLLIERDVLIPTRDGGAVCANVFRPEGAGEFPVIITMGPYPKDIHFSDWNPVAWRHVPEHGPHMHWETVNPEWWVPRGYVVIRCDSRGTGKSPGRPRLLSRSEAEDFFDAVEWACTRAWSNGKDALTVSFCVA